MDVENGQASPYFGVTKLRLKANGSIPLLFLSVCTTSDGEGRKHSGELKSFIRVILARYLVAQSHARPSYL